MNRGGGSGPPKKKKRLAPTLLQPVPASAKIVSSSQPDNNSQEVMRQGQPSTLSLSLADDTDVVLSKTPRCEIRTLHTHADLQRTLAHYTNLATQTQSSWVRDPDANWIQALKAEVLQDDDNKETLQTLANTINLTGTLEPAARFSDRADFATRILELWLANKSLDEVLVKAKELGQLDLPAGGIILTGDVVQEYLSHQQPELGNLATLYPVVERLTILNNSDTNSREQDAKIQLSECDSQNKFSVRSHQEYTSLSHLKNCDSHSLDNCGSLNTTHLYGVVADDSSHKKATSKRTSTHHNLPFLKDSYINGQCGVTFLDEMYDELEDLTSDPSSSVALNSLLYLIWKGPGYMTAYHQDTHTPPQITIYNQLSGESIFHFLPPLLGMYVTLGNQGAAATQQTLEALDAKGIGCTAHLKPGSVALIFPFGSHGVFVPKRPNEPAAQTSPPLLSTIRAAELFVEPLYRTYQRKLSESDWCRNLMPACEKDKQIAEQFEAAQKELMKTLDINPEEWIYHSNWMLEKWTEKESARMDKKEHT